MCTVNLETYGGALDLLSDGLNFVHIRFVGIVPQLYAMSPHGLNKRFIREKFVVSRLNLILNLDVFFTDYHLKKKKTGKTEKCITQIQNDFRKKATLSKTEQSFLIRTIVHRRKERRSAYNKIEKFDTFRPVFFFFCLFF